MTEFALVGDFTAALFDMDGTLVNSTALVEREWEQWATEKGLSPREVAHFSHGHRSEDVIRHYFPDAELSNELVAFREAAAILDQSSVFVIPGALEFVKSLSSMEWAVVTSAPAAIASKRLAVCGFPAPTVLVSADDVQFGKPHPEGFVRASQQLGKDPGTCIVFEDAPAGVAAAVAASMRVVVLRTTHTDSVFRDCVQIDDFRDVRAAILPSGGFRLTAVQI